MPSQFGSNILSHSKRLMNNVFREIDGFYSNNIYYGDTDSGYIHKKHWSTLVKKGFVGKSLGLGKMITVIQVYSMLGFWLRR